MEDIRLAKAKRKMNNKYKLLNFFHFFKKNWKKMVLLLVVISFIMYPDIIGNLLGSWWNELVSSFLEKLTY
jgi:hypothetical protein